MTEDDLSKIVVGRCIKIHRTLGPACWNQFTRRYCATNYKKPVFTLPGSKPSTFSYDDLDMDIGFRADVIVENKLLLELKSVEMLTPVHQKILLTYLRITGIKLGLLINFHEELLKNGIKRIVNKL